MNIVATGKRKDAETAMRNCISTGSGVSDASNRPDSREKGECEGDGRLMSRPRNGNPDLRCTKQSTFIVQTRVKDYFEGAIFTENAEAKSSFVPNRK